MTTSTLPTSPFSPNPSNETTDRQLVEDAKAGDRQALESLVKKHQPWIYNVAFRMVLVHEDAEDVTQEILVKMITKLTTYDPSKAAFSTWLYRVVANHVINMKKRGYEALIGPIEDYYGFVTQVPDQDPDTSPDTELLVRDLKIGCVMGTLLCLERAQRLAFVLAVAFNVSDAQGSEILQISKANFRKTLSRARAKLHQYMSGNCGVVNPDAPCSCRKKIKGFSASGAYSIDRINFFEADAPRLEALVGETVDRFNKEIYPEFAQLYREHPFYGSPEITTWLRELVERSDFKEVFQLS